MNLYFMKRQRQKLNLNCYSVYWRWWFLTQAEISQQAFGLHMTAYLIMTMMMMMMMMIIIIIIIIIIITLVIVVCSWRREWG